MKHHIVPNWRQSWKWLSLQCMAGALAIQEAWIYVPDDLKSHIPPALVADIGKWLLVLGIIGRYLNQGGTKHVDVDSCAVQQPVSEMAVNSGRKFDATDGGLCKRSNQRDIGLQIKNKSAAKRKPKSKH